MLRTELPLVQFFAPQRIFFLMLLRFIDALIKIVDGGLIDNVNQSRNDLSYESSSRMQLTGISTTFIADLVLRISSATK